MDFQHSYTDVDGVRLHWAECGVPSGLPPLVLIHGIHDSHLTWKTLAPLLAKGRRVLMPDLAGCGLSARPDASYELAWHARIIAKWIKQLRLGRVDVVGHSFGGGVAQMLLLDPRVQVRRLGLIASGGLGERVGIWLRVAALPGVVERFGQPFMAAGTRFSVRSTGARFAENDLALLCKMNGQSGSARAFARTVKDVISWRGQVRCFFHHAHRITRFPSVALFWGDRDEITPIAGAHAFTSCVDGATLEPFPGCGHYVHHEQPRELAKKLLAFLEAPYVRRIRVRAAVPVEVSIWQRVRGLFVAPQPLSPAATRSLELTRRPARAGLHVGLSSAA